LNIPKEFNKIAACFIMFENRVIMLSIPRNHLIKEYFLIPVYTLNNTVCKTLNKISQWFTRCILFLYHLPSHLTNAHEKFIINLKIENSPPVELSDINNIESVKNTVDRYYSDLLIYYENAPHIAKLFSKAKETILTSLHSNSLERHIQLISEAIPPINDETQTISYNEMIRKLFNPPENQFIFFLPYIEMLFSDVMRQDRFQGLKHAFGLRGETDGSNTSIQIVLCEANSPALLQYCEFHDLLSQILEALQKIPKPVEITSEQLEHWKQIAINHLLSQPDITKDQLHAIVSSDLSDLTTEAINQDVRAVLRFLYKDLKIISAHGQGILHISFQDLLQHLSPKKQLTAMYISNLFNIIKKTRNLQLTYRVQKSIKIEVQIDEALWSKACSTKEIQAKVALSQYNIIEFVQNKNQESEGDDFLLQLKNHLIKTCNNLSLSDKSEIRHVIRNLSDPFGDINTILKLAKNTAKDATPYLSYANLKDLSINQISEYNELSENNKTIFLKNYIPALLNHMKDTKQLSSYTLPDSLDLPITLVFDQNLIE